MRVVTITNDFQSVVYNNLRDAHSQTVRKKNREAVQRLLACNQQDSLVKGIKMLGFTLFLWIRYNQPLGNCGLKGLC